MTRPIRDAIRDSYEEVTYIAGPQYATHPSRLAAVATLMGLSPQDPTQCRVLEIGCATGGNLIPMAAQFPASEFVGFDLSPRQIEYGVDLITAAGLTNIRLDAMDAMAVEDPRDHWGQFDYILCHGVFSWVPSDVQDQILRICKECLTPSGVAYVSYNTYPGSQTRDLARGVARFGAAHVLEDARNVPQVLALWKAVAEAMPDEDHVVALQLERALKEVSDAEEYYVVHEYLEDVNQPLWFYEFADRAKEAGLQYLGDSGRNAGVSDFPDETQQAIAQMAPSLIAQEQFVDLAFNSSFRRTLLCLDNVEVPRAPQPGVIEKLYAFSTTSSMPKDDQGRVTFRTRAGREFTTNIPLLVEALEHLQRAWPDSAPMVELYAVASQSDAVRAAPAAPSDADFFMTALMRLWLQNAVELQVTPSNLTAEIGERPCVHPYARLQADRGLPLTNLLHQEVVLPDEDARMVHFVDGTRDRPALERVWAEARPEQPEGEKLTEFLERLSKAGFLWAPQPSDAGD